MGQHINSFFRIRCKLSELGEDKKHLTGADRRHITMFGKYTDIYASKSYQHYMHKKSCGAFEVKVIKTFWLQRYHFFYIVYVDTISYIEEK